MALEQLTGLPDMNMDLSETGCCPRFEPEKWDQKLMHLEHLPMVKASTRSIFYMPLNMGRVMGETMKAIEAESAACRDRYLILSKDVSPWRCEHHFLVEKPVAALENLWFSGDFVTLVFEGDYGQISKWIPQLKARVESEGHDLKGIYAFYTTCPKCAKHFGKNYVVLFGQV